MKVRELMQARVITVRPDDDLGLAAQMMAWSSIQHLPVIERGRVVGVLSERDVVRHAAQGGARQQVAVAMALPPQALHPDDDVALVAERLAQSPTGCLPVVERESLVGIVTPTDLITRLARETRPPPESPSANGPAVREIMTPDPLTVSFEDDIFEAAGRMSRFNVRHAPVVDTDGHVVGMLSDRDLRAELGRASQVARGDARTTVQEVGTTGAITVQEGASLEEVIGLLLDNRIGAVPVVDADEHLVGIVSYVDILARGRPGETERRRDEGRATAPHHPP